MEIGGREAEAAAAGRVAEAALAATHERGTAVSVELDNASASGLPAAPLLAAGASMLPSLDDLFAAGDLL
jgi:hypothetical protein